MERHRVSMVHWGQRVQVLRKNNIIFQRIDTPASIRYFNETPNPTWVFLTYHRHSSYANYFGSSFSHFNDGHLRFLTSIPDAQNCRTRIGKNVSVAKRLAIGGMCAHVTTLFCFQMSRLLGWPFINSTKKVDISPRFAAPFGLVDTFTEYTKPVWSNDWHIYLEIDFRLGRIEGLTCARRRFV